MAEKEKTESTSANNLDEGISRLDRTLNKIYLPEIMAARRVIHSRMRRKRERQVTGPPRGGPTLYDYIIASRRRPGDSRQLSEETLDEEPEDNEKRQQNAPTRQDSVFQSVDLSEIAGLREDPNRTPTPQPTFTDGPMSQRRQSNKVMAATVLSSVVEKNKVNSTSSSSRSSVKSDEVIHESYELQVKPGYADAHQVEMATQAASARGQLKKSNSFHGNSGTNTLGERQDSTVSEPGDVKEKSVKKKQQVRQANDLDLAQKIILKRKVEEYIDRQEPEVSMEDEVSDTEYDDRTISNKEQKIVTREEVSVKRETVWDKGTGHSVEEEAITARDVVILTSGKTGRESVQTVISHKSDSSTEAVTVKEDRRGNDSPQSRSSTSASELNPHPVIPAIGATVNTTNEQSEADDTDVEEEDTESADVTTAVAVAGGAVAAGGATAAIAVHANKSNKKSKKKSKRKSKEKPADKSPEHSEEETPEEPREKRPEKEKKEKKPTIKAVVPVEEADNEPKQEKRAAEAASGNAPSKPAKADRNADNKPFTLKDMSTNDMKSTIDALEEMVDNNLQSVIDNTKGKKNKKSKETPEDKTLMNAVMNPAFQAEINSFLAQT